MTGHMADRVTALERQAGYLRIQMAMWLVIAVAYVAMLAWQIAGDALADDPIPLPAAPAEMTCEWDATEYGLPPSNMSCRCTVKAD